MTADQPLPDLFITRRALRPILPKIHRALDSAAQQALLHFESVSYDFEGGLHAALVRAQARLVLKQLGFTLEDLPSNGICLHFEDFRIKILKAREDDLPETNQSKARLQFFKQEILLTAAEFRPRVWNLLILWDVDAKLNLANLRVACTKPIDGDPEGYETYWQFAIEHPAELLAADSATIEDDQDDDLGYSLLDRHVADDETLEAIAPDMPVIDGVESDQLGYATPDSHATDADEETLG
jgi:hypothetical protein